ncbi:hypothetical protein M911_15985 [Ectothiorhodospira haloalkaliphila]|nr:hypothetical protein M911_15985 [Ectothiorhodospira haloalkaliphila]
MLAVMIGFIGGVLVVFSIILLDKVKIDDPAGAISAHGTAGIWGVFAVLLSNPDASFVAQLVGVLSIFAFVFTASLLVWLILKYTMGIRISEEDEMRGVDIAECGLEAYPEFTPGRK